MRVLRAVNGVVMFTLELAVYVLAALAAWRLGDGGLLGGGLACVAVGVLVAVWARWGAPKALRPVVGWRRILLEVLWFGVGGAALLRLGYAGWATAYELAWLANLVLRRAAGQLA